MTSAIPTWLITGTSNGFGLALAQHVLTAGHNLISLSRHVEPHPSFAGIVSSSTFSPKRSLHHLRHDLSTNDETVLKSLITSFLRSHSEINIDVLVNNAAITVFAPIETILTSTVHEVMTVNFYSPLWMIQACLPNMRASHNSSPKVIVNISSTQGLCQDPSELAYDASKHALEALSGVLVKEVSPFNIRVINANLGSFRTAFATSGDRAKAARAPPAVEGSTESGREDSIWKAPYDDPEHPATARVNMVKKYANVPNAAKGDPSKGAAILFDAVMCREGSEANEALEKQMVNAGTGQTKGGTLERLLIGSDGWPKIRGQVELLRTQIESCESVAKLSNADDVRQ